MTWRQSCGHRWPALFIAVLALSGGACSTTPRALAARPLPVVLNPSEPPWGISVSIEPSDVLRVRLVNESPQPISVLWQECAYIDVENRSHPVTALSSQQPRATIPPGAHLEERLLPVAQPGDSRLDPLLPVPRRAFGWLVGSEPRVRFGSRVTANHPVLGREVGLFLVLERGGDKKTLLAKYAIEEADR